MAGFLSDRFGRRKVLFLCAIFYAVSAVLSAVPRTFDEFLVARFNAIKDSRACDVGGDVYDLDVVLRGSPDVSGLERSSGHRSRKDICGLRGVQPGGVGVLS